MVLSTNKKSQPLEAINVKITAQQAIDYISSNPQLLLEHPHLLAELLLPFSDSPASLVERQIKKLRQKNQSLEAHVKQLASQQEKARDLQDKSLRFINAVVCSKSFEMFMLRLEHQCLKAKLKNFRLCLYPHAASELIDKTKQYRRHFKILSQKSADNCQNSLLVKHQILMGPQREALMLEIFGTYSSKMSAALIPMKGRIAYGVLAFAEAETSLYTPHADLTLFVTLQTVLPSILDSFLNNY